jgi:hypothetical protein
MQGLDADASALPCSYASHSGISQWQWFKPSQQTYKRRSVQKAMRFFDHFKRIF